MGLASDLADMAEDARQQLYETNEQLRVGHTTEQTVMHGNEPGLNSDNNSSKEHDNQQVQKQNQQPEIER